ncbi:hypothetical protein OPV22_016007 [Ensete ventricosum]|uniref:ubiquitinyl hydrolase 1 n=1 Tax=Ensete ventricosum TaxID=4639 RepID=A0AAV8R9I1_ENSVE|nr:hypothetical protein OPV22_016007 [Ensete ventricosum]
MLQLWMLDPTPHLFLEWSELLKFYVLQKALEIWDLQVVPLNSPAAELSKFEPELENAFICHLHDHWFCIRKVNGEWTLGGASSWLGIAKSCNQMKFSTQEAYSSNKIDTLAEQEEEDLNAAVKASLMDYTSIQNGPDVIEDSAILGLKVDPPINNNSSFMESCPHSTESGESSSDVHNGTRGVETRSSSHDDKVQ